jgi:hypothetical protein
MLNDGHHIAQYLVHPGDLLVEHLKFLAAKYNVSICGTIVEPQNHEPEQEPKRMPDLAFEQIPGSERSPRADQEWTKYIQRVYGQSPANRIKIEEGVQHVREGDSKDLPSGRLLPNSDDKDDLKSERVEEMINVAYVIEGGTGHIVGRYVKENLWISERLVYNVNENHHFTY